MRRKPVPEDVTMTCEFCGTQAAMDQKFTRACRWQWFTGYRTRTFHCCPRCYESRPRAYLAALHASRDPALADLDAKEQP